MQRSKKQKMMLKETSPLHDPIPNTYWSLLIDNSTKSRRVIFAEASKDYVDFLFHILSLPVATTIRLLQEEGMVGSLPNLCKSLESLDYTYIQPGRDKNTYLKPAAPVSSSWAPLLALEAPSVEKKFYRCGASGYGYGASASGSVEGFAGEEGCSYTRLLLVGV